MYSSAIRGCHEEGSGVGTNFRDFVKLPGHTKLITWPEIRAAAAGRALDRQAWRDAIRNLAPLEFKKPQQVKRMTRSFAHRGGSPSLVNGALCNGCDLAAENMAVIASGKASVKSVNACAWGAARALKAVASEDSCANVAATVRGAATSAQVSNECSLGAACLQSLAAILVQRLGHHASLVVEQVQSALLATSRWAPCKPR
eukprot:53023-Chlamydomonas_euryale.AAC.1